MKIGLKVAPLFVAVLIGTVATLGCAGAAPPATVARDVTRLVHDGCLLVLDLATSGGPVEVCDRETDLYPLVDSALAAAERSTATTTTTATTGGASTPAPGGTGTGSIPGKDPASVRSLSCPSGRTDAPAVVIRPNGSTVQLRPDAAPVIARVRARKASPQ